MELPAGTHSIEYDLQSYPAGTYFVTFQIDDVPRSEVSPNHITGSLLRLDEYWLGLRLLRSLMFSPTKIKKTKYQFLLKNNIKEKINHNYSLWHEEELNF